MQNGNRASNLGIYVYAAGAIFLGILGLASGDFAATWQNISPKAPFREVLVYLAALIELGAGVALLWRRTARVGALALTAVYAVFMLMWVPKYLGNLRNFDPLGNVFEQFSLVVAGAVLFASFSPASSFFSRRELSIARLYGSPQFLSALGTFTICRAC